MSLSDFTEHFSSIAANEYRESFFFDNISLPVEQNPFIGPNLTCDLLEIDGSGRLHLWLFVAVESPELASGEAIGRLFACTQALRMSPPAALAARLSQAAWRRRYDTRSERFQAAVRRTRASFDSWNLVACGGSGCELAGREDNLLFQIYASLSSVIGHVRDVNTWHFYETATGFDLRCLWDLAGCGALSLTDKLAAYGGDRLAVSAAPEDDFDIASKHDLHLKRRKGFHAQAADAYFADRAAILAR